MCHPSLFFRFATPFFQALSFSVFFARLVAAAARTVAIDDTYGDALTGAMPVYSPDGAWTQGQPCPLDECLVNPDPKLVGNGTWHDSVGITADAPPRTIELTFEGNSVDVFCIISEVDRKEIAVSNMTFELDGQEGTPFFHDVSGETVDPAGDIYKITYNVSVYKDTFAQGRHTLRINSVGYSRMLFDYALYTTEADLSSNTSTTAPPSGSTGRDPQHNALSRSPRRAVIIGATVGVSIVVLAIVVGVYLLIRRRRRSRDAHVHVIDSLSPRDRRVYRKDNIDAQYYVSSSESLALEPRAATPFFSYYGEADYLASQTSISPLAAHEDREAEERHAKSGPSPSDTIPLVQFPAPPSGIDANRSGQRIIVTGEEMHLIGPDNSMARFARQKAAEREAELTRRMREMEAAIAAKYEYATTVSGPSSKDGAAAETSSLPHRSDTVRTAGSQSSEAGLRSQVEELRAEIGRMRAVQQQMARELMDVAEPPPEYQ